MPTRRSETPALFLLDVNALVALGFLNHEFHPRLASWMQSHPAPRLATCSITELGFVRVLAQAPAYRFTVVQGRTLLLRLKSALDGRLTFLPYAQDASHLPAWVRSPKQITGGHLVQLAAANQAMLATLDESIPHSFRIPR